jgi:hypothetical protein
LKVIHRMDQINYERRIQKKGMNSNLAMWEKPEMDKYIYSDFYMAMEDLRKESRELAQHKLNKEIYDQKMKENYLKCLKKIYRFKEFVDDTNFEKIFTSEKISEIEAEMKLFSHLGDAHKMTTKPRPKLRRKELKLEYHDFELKTSSSEMAESSDEEFNEEDQNLVIRLLSKYVAVKSKEEGFLGVLDKIKVKGNDDESSGSDDEGIQRFDTTSEVGKGLISKFGFAAAGDDDGGKGIESKNGDKMVKLDLGAGVQRLTFENQSTSNRDKEQLNTPQGEQLKASDQALGNLEQLSLKDSEKNYLKPDSARPEGGSPRKLAQEKLNIRPNSPKKKGTRASKSPKKSPSKVGRIGSALLGLKIPSDTPPKKSKSDQIFDTKSMISSFTMKVGQTELNKERKKNYPDHVMKFLKPDKAKKCEKWVAINDMLNTGGSPDPNPKIGDSQKNNPQEKITEEMSISRKSESSCGK